MASRSGKGLLVVGYLLAIVLPVVGFFLGAFVLIRRRSWHGAAIVAVSVVAALSFLVLASSEDDGGEVSPAFEREYRKVKDCLERESRRSSVDEIVRACTGPSVR